MVPGRCNWGPLNPPTPLLLWLNRQHFIAYQLLLVPSEEAGAVFDKLFNELMVDSRWWHHVFWRRHENAPWTFYVTQTQASQVISSHYLERWIHWSQGGKYVVLCVSLRFPWHANGQQN